MVINMDFNGLKMGSGNLSRLSLRLRGPSAEKYRPVIMINSSETTVIADIEGSGAIQSIWTAGYIGRDFIYANDLGAVYHAF